MQVLDGVYSAKASAPTSGDVVYVKDGQRSGIFFVKQGSIPFSDESEAIYFASNTTGYYYERDTSGSTAVNFLWCGAIQGDDPATDNWAAWIKAVRFCGLTGRKLYLPSGRYRFITGPWVDLSLFSTSGLTVFGDGHGRSIIDCRSSTAVPNMKIFSSNGASYYFNMHDVGIVGDLAGAVLQIGQSDYSDPPNLYRFTGVSVANYNTTPASRGAVLNFVVGSWFDWQVGCGSGGYIGGEGVALTLRQCEFNQFFGSMGSAEIGVLFDGGHSFGNVFTTPDFENVKTCVRLKSGGSYNNNTFLGGQWSYSTKGIDCQTGSKTVVINPTNTYNSPAGSGDFVGGSTGLTVS